MATFQELVTLTMEEAGVQQEMPPAISLGSGIGMLSDFERWVKKAYEDVQGGHPQWSFRKDIGQLVFKAGQYTYNLPSLLSGISTVDTIRRNFQDTLKLTIADSDGNVSERSIRWLPWAEWMDKHGTEQIVQELVFTSAAAPTINNGDQIALTTPAGNDTDPQGIVVWASYDSTAQEETIRVLIERRLFTTFDTVTVGSLSSVNPTSTDITYGQEGVPQEFTIDPDDQMLLYPIPDSNAVYAISFPYTKSIDKFDTASPNAVAVVPDDYKWAIVARALMYYYEYATNPNGYAAAMSNYKHWMDRMGSEELPTMRFNPVQLY